MRDAARRFGLPTFWRWWMAELAPLVPAGARGAIKRRRTRPLLAFAADVAVLWVPRMHEGALAFVEAARIPLSGDAAAVAQAGRAAIDALPATAYGGPANAAKLVVALPRGEVLRKRIVLPAAIEENLRQALAYDLDRHTPFRPEQLYFDAVIVDRDAVRNELQVDWAAVLKTAADPLRRMAESWGATVVGITPDVVEGKGAAPIAVSKLNLLPHEERVGAASWRRWQWWVPAAAVLLFAAVALLLPIWQKRDYAVALTGVTEKARVEAEAADALRQQVDRLAGDYNFALGQKYMFPAAVQLLEDVTKLLPDDTWLTQIEMRTTARGKEPRREIALRGESANAGRIVALLEESKLFTDAAPRSPTTKIQPGPGEIFDLGAQLRRMSAPQPVVLGSEEAEVLLLPVPTAAVPETFTDSAASAGSAQEEALPAAAPGMAPNAAPAAATAPAAAAPLAAAPQPPPQGGRQKGDRRANRRNGGRSGPDPAERQAPAVPERPNPRLVDD